MTQDTQFARVLQLREDGLSFRAIDKKMFKTDSSGSRAFGLLKRAIAAKKAAKRTAKKTAKPVAAEASNGK